MSLVFYSNFINHHLSTLLDELYDYDNGQCWFVETMQIPSWLIQNGYTDSSSRSYVIQAWKDDVSKKKAEELCINADVAIFGADSLEYQIIRAKAMAQEGHS